MAVTIRSLQPVRVQYPGSEFTGRQATYLRQIADALNTLPPLSTFSFGNPNGNVTAIIGTIGVNINSAATAHVWYKNVGSGATGWVSVVTA